MDTDKEKEEIVATLQSMQKAQHRQRWEIRIWLTVGFGGLYFWAQYRAIFLVFEWISLWRPCW